MTFALYLFSLAYSFWSATFFLPNVRRQMQSSYHFTTLKKADHWHVNTVIYHSQRRALPQIGPQIVNSRFFRGFANLISYRKYLRICGKKTEIYRKSAKQ